ncbi:MAG TPA: DUF5947 family protein [Solirubrobacteraceae bacterium]
MSAIPPGAANADVVASLRRMARPRAAPAPPSVGGDARCDLCGARMSEEHRHLLDVHGRRILCACEPCCAMRSGEDDLRPTGTRTLRLEGFELSDELWAQFQIPIGLAFFFVSDVAGGVVALYPSPAGATECDLYLAAWNELVAANPVLADLEPEVEALIVNRLADPPVHAIVPIDRCYELVGMIKARWEGISGGDAVEHAVEAFFARLTETRSAV